MRLVNDTPFSAVLPTTVLDETRMAASLVARVTFELREAKRKGLAELWFSDEQVWLASETPQTTPRGPMEADGPFVRGGVDLHLFGSARTPKGRPASELDVEIQVGDFTRRAHVTGDRVWLRRANGSHEASEAARFVEMPLTLPHAFGGKDTWDGLEVPWQENPEGKGFVIDEKDLEGRPLPNLEEPAARIKTWEDRPPACGFGFCPMANLGRLGAGLVLAEDMSEILDFTPRLFNAAYAPMVAPSVAPGATVTIRGMRHEGPLSFEVPAPPFDLHLEFGENKPVRTPYVDGIGVEVDEMRLFVSYRFPFKYEVRPRELRRATLALASED